jgi:hypothetical protein
MTNPLRKLWRRAAPSSNSCRKNDLEAKTAGSVLHLSDRRLANRQFHPLTATLRYGLGAAETPIRIHDFSDKGLCFRGQIHLPIGAAVEITATLPQNPGGSRKVRYLAHVVRVTREPGKFVTAVLIFNCETLVQETDVATAGAETCAGASSEASSKAEKEARSKPVVSAWRNQGLAKLTPEDCRQFSRYHCASHVQFRQADGGSIHSGEVANLSLAGCYIRTPQPCPVGSDVEIVVQAGKARIYSPGRVKSVKENQGMAVEFVGDLPQRLQRLPRLVQVVSASGPQPNHPSN